MSEMVERVARAIMDNIRFRYVEEIEKVELILEQSGLDPDKICRISETSIEKTVRAAIEAMREPTDEMLQSSMSPFIEINQMIGFAASHGLRLTEHPDGPPFQRAWRAMIDAALK